MDIQPYSYFDDAKLLIKFSRTLLMCTGFLDPNAREACSSQFLVENELLFPTFFSLNQRLYSVRYTCNNASVM